MAQTQATDRIIPLPSQPPVSQPSPPCSMHSYCVVRKKTPHPRTRDRIDASTDPMRLHPAAAASKSEMAQYRVKLVGPMVTHAPKLPTTGPVCGFTTTTTNNNNNKSRLSCVSACSTTHNARTHEVHAVIHTTACS